MRSHKKKAVRSWKVKSQKVKSRKVKAQKVKSRKVKSQKVKSHKVKPRKNRKVRVNDGKGGEKDDYESLMKTVEEEVEKKSDDYESLMKAIEEEEKEPSEVISARLMKFQMEVQDERLKLEKQTQHLWEIQDMLKQEKNEIQRDFENATEMLKEDGIYKEHEMRKLENATIKLNIVKKDEEGIERKLEELGKQKDKIHKKQEEIYEIYEKLVEQRNKEELVIRESKKGKIFPIITFKSEEYPDTEGQQKIWAARCPICKNVDIRFNLSFEDKKKSSMIITETYSSGLQLTCLACKYRTSFMYRIPQFVWIEAENSILIPLEFVKDKLGVDITKLSPPKQ
jgi:hypothetical protein